MRVFGLIFNQPDAKKPGFKIPICKICGGSTIAINFLQGAEDYCLACGSTNFNLIDINSYNSIVRTNVLDQILNIVSRDVDKEVTVLFKLKQKLKSLAEQEKLLKASLLDHVRDCGTIHHQMGTISHRNSHESKRIRGRQILYDFLGRKYGPKIVSDVDDNCTIKSYVGESLIIRLR